MNQKIRALVWDLDGTLLDTIPDLTKALNAALAQKGYPARSEKEVSLCIGGGIRQTIAKAVAAPITEAEIDAVDAVYQSLYPNHCTELTRPYPGIPEVLAALTARGIRQGVLSNKTEGTTRKIIAHFFPETEFAFVLGNDGRRPLKPDPAAGAEVSAALGLAPAEIGYIGDSGTDMTFAQAVGFYPIGAAWGYRGAQELAASGAAALPIVPRDILTLL